MDNKVSEQKDSAGEGVPLTKSYKEHLRESLKTLDDYVGYLSACHDEGADVFQLAVQDVLSFARVSPVTVDEKQNSAFSSIQAVAEMKAELIKRVREKLREYDLEQFILTPRGHRAVTLQLVIDELATELEAVEITEQSNE